VRAERARRRLREFVRQAWPILEPGTPYVHGWHIDAICEHLEGITQGHLHNLIINVPPRHMKSYLVCVFWPAWEWIEGPWLEYLTSSYGADLAIRDAVKSRWLIQSSWYQSRWGDRFHLAGDQNLKSRYENDHGGHRIATGVGGGATGEGGHRIIVDDPVKADDAYSDTVRQGANDWWDNTMSTRGNDPKTVARVIIMQRLAEDDLTGHVLEKMGQGGEQYEHLCLPARYEPRHTVTCLGWKDPRAEPGALLWPERFGEEELGRLEVTLGEMGTAGQLQQRPAPAGGAIFKRDWWPAQRRYDAGDKGIYRLNVGRYLSFDTALKDEERNDYTAWGVWELTRDYQLLLRGVDQARLQLPQLATTIEQTGERWNYDGKLQGILVEDKNSGTSALQTLRQSAAPEIAGLLIAFEPKGSKEYRARQASLWCERGMILLPHPGEQVPWLLEFEETLFKFPAVKHDDVVDQMTQLIIYLEHYLAAGWQARLTQTGDAR
jgi:predicted phage terminase large subunit-like protein